MFSCWACCAGVAPGEAAAARAAVTASKVPRSWAAYPLTVSTRLGTRSWRRVSSTSIWRQDSWTRLRCLTKRLYETTTAISSRTTTASTIQPHDDHVRTSDVVRLRLGRLPRGDRIRGPATRTTGRRRSPASDGPAAGSTSTVSNGPVSHDEDVCRPRSARRGAARRGASPWSEVSARRRRTSGPGCVTVNARLKSSDSSSMSLPSPTPWRHPVQDVLGRSPAGSAGTPAAPSATTPNGAWSSCWSALGVRACS